MVERDYDTFQTLGLMCHIMAFFSPVIGYFISGYVMNKMLWILVMLFTIPFTINGIFLLIKNIESVKYTDKNKSFYCSGNDEESLEDSDTEKTIKPRIIKTFISFPVTGCFIIMVLIITLLVLFTFINYIIIDNNNKKDKLDIYESKLGIFSIMETFPWR